MLIKFQNVTIRNAVSTDAAQLAAWWNDGAVMAHAGFPNGTGQTKEEIAHSLKNDTDDTHRRLIIEIDQIPVGEMNVRNLGEGIAEIGIKICDFSKQDKGYGTIILCMLISSLFDDKGYEKIILDTNTNNHRAQHVYQKLGFRKIQVRENSWRNQLGELQSSIDYELRVEDFVYFSK